MATPPTGLARKLSEYGGTPLFTPPVTQGPNSTELAIHIGYRRAGWLGLVVAGACFILPAALMVTVLAWAYVRYGMLPEVDAVLRGVKPVVISIIVLALWRLAQTAVKTSLLGFLGAACATAMLLGIHELAVLAAAGLLMALTRSGSRSAAPSPVSRSPGSSGCSGTSSSSSVRRRYRTSGR